MRVDHAGRASLNLLRELGRNVAGGLRIAPLLRRSGDGPVRIAFQSYSVHLAQMYRTIVARLREREDTEVIFVPLSHPQFPPDEMSRLADFAHDELGIPRDRIRPYHETLWEPFDLAIYNDVYARFPLARTCNCLLTHGPLLEERFLEPGRLRKSVADFDIVAVAGRHDQEKANAALRGARRPPLVACVGLPFLDRLYDPPVDREVYLRGLSLDPGASTVVVAPHWTSLREPGGADRLERAVAAVRWLEMNVVIKPHACSLVDAMAGGVDWRSRLESLAGDGRVGIDFDPDDVPAFVHGDVLVSDQSSRSMIFMLLGKPAIEFTPPSVDADGSERMAVIRSGAHVARTPEDLVALLEGPERLEPRSGAREVAARCVAFPGRSTERFIEVVERALPSGSPLPPVRSIGMRLRPSPLALGRPRDSSPVLDDPAELRARLAEDGYLYLRGYFEPDEILAARRQVAESLAARDLLDPAKPVMECAAVSDDRIPVEGEDGRFPAVVRVLRGERMLALYRRLLGGEIRPYDHVWLRLMNPGQATGPHCDIVYMGRGTRRLYTSWVPLGDVPTDHGALMILEGSHLLTHLAEDYVHMDVDEGRNWWRPRFRHGRLFRGGDYSRNPRAVQRQFNRRWLTTDYSAGDLVVFHTQTMHGSLDNTSGTLRLSADSRYQLASEPADERWVGPDPKGHSTKG